MTEKSMIMTLTDKPEKAWEELFGNKRGERGERSTRARRKRKENRYAKEKRLYGK